MKAFYLVTGICATALLGACTTVYEKPVAAVPASPSVAYVTPAPAATYVAPGTTVVVPSR